MRPW